MPFLLQFTANNTFRCSRFSIIYGEFLLAKTAWFEYMFRFWKLINSASIYVLCFVQSWLCTTLGLNRHQRCLVLGLHISELPTEICGGPFQLSIPSLRGALSLSHEESCRVENGSISGYPDISSALFKFPGWSLSSAFEQLHFVHLRLPSTSYDRIHLPCESNKNPFQFSFTPCFEV